MAAASHNPSFAKKAGIKPSVAKEFMKADESQPLQFKTASKPKNQKQQVGKMFSERGRSAQTKGKLLKSGVSLTKRSK